MAENVNLNTVGNLQDTTTAQTVLNANNALIETAFSDVLSLSGVSPNQMQSNLDMNSNQILNLPAPATINSPVRLGDVISASTAITIPPVGTSGAVVGLLNTNNTYSGTSKFTGVSKFQGSAVLVGATTLFNFENSVGVSGQALVSGGTSLSPAWSNARQVQAANTVYYVSNSGSDSNNGSSSAPFATIQKAYNNIIYNVDLAGTSATISLAAGTYTGLIATAGPFLGNALVSILGSGSATTFIQCTANGYGIQVKDLTVLTVSGVTIEDNGSSNGAWGILCQQLGIIDVESDVKFGTIANGLHIGSTNGGNVNIIGGYTVIGHAATHWFVSEYGRISAGSSIITMSSALAFSVFGEAQYQGCIDATGVSFTGPGATTCTGLRFSNNYGGLIVTGGVDINSIFPGNSSGSYVAGPQGAHWDAANTGIWTSGILVTPSMTTPTITGTVSGAITFATPPATLVYTVTTLNAISSPATGMRAIVTDATGTTFGAVVSGGSTFVTPVYYNGSWRIG